MLGAFGFGQFIPSSFNRLSIDYNNDGKKDPFSWEDVMGSVSILSCSKTAIQRMTIIYYKSKAWRVHKNV